MENLMTDLVPTKDAPVELSDAELVQVAGGIVKDLPFAAAKAIPHSPVIFNQKVAVVLQAPPSSTP